MIFKRISCVVLLCIFSNGSALEVLDAEPADSRLVVSPATFEDTGKPFYEFTCETKLIRHQWLSWYQEKPSEKKTIILVTEDIRERLQKLDLLLPIDQSDFGSIIYCVSHKEYFVNGTKHYEEISRSDEIQIIFDKNNYPLKKLATPQVTPATFNDEPIAEFTCWAHLILEPKQRPRLSWYQVKGKGNTPQLMNVTEQIRYYAYVKVIFWKILEPSDIGSYIYCAKETTNDSSTDPYMETNVTDPITFTTKRKANDSRNTILAVIIPILLAIVVGLAYWTLRRYRSIHNTSTITAPAEDYQEKPKETESKSTPYPSKTKGSTAKPHSSNLCKLTPRPDLTLNPLKSTKMRPTTAPKPDIAARPFVAPLQTPLTPTETPVSTATLTTVTPKPPTTPEDDPVYGNYNHPFCRYY